MLDFTITLIKLITVIVELTVALAKAKRKK